MNGSKKRKKTNRENPVFPAVEQDEHFYFIAGYTDGGAPYGITWEEHESKQSYVSDSRIDMRESRMQELKLTERQLQELIETYDMHVDGIEFFLNIETGDIVTLNSFDRDEEDQLISEIIEEAFNEIYYRMPYRESEEGYMDMFDFAETVSNEKIEK
ncbi:hypothetical protein SD71_00310 [Cohnella kolymensis]|uniref:Uncharacterized protein n=1 Tax=Cohnella kolymensis TaxID=1590652 RepID=A0ABR5A887_9BACL|nr:hypothetical protein [Cohnella kolymensis]KIL37219.1 hypothetical protein SD71_00310 [Cohnella kolymensis]